MVKNVNSLNENQEFRGLDQSMLHNTSRNNAFLHDNRKCQLILQMKAWRKCAALEKSSQHTILAEDLSLVYNYRRNRPKRQ